MAAIPVKIEKFFDSEKDEFTSIAQANWQKMAALLEYCNRSHPIGMLLFMNESQDVLPATPDPNYWHFMDGSTISNPNSPCDGQTPPDLRHKFMRHPKTGDPVLVPGGQNTVNLNHNHGGATGFGFDVGPNVAASGTDVPYPPVGYHQHAINSSLGVTSTIPRYQYLQVYMRIA